MPHQKHQDPQIITSITGETMGEMPLELPPILTKMFDLDCEWTGRRKGLTYHYTGAIELDQRILDNVDDAWRASFYDLHDEQAIAEHVAYNFVVNEVRGIWELDGFANLPTDTIVKLWA